MTVTKQIEDAGQFHKLWAALMPDSEVPEPTQFLQWAGIFDHEIILKGINRAAAKRRKVQDTSPMSLNDTIRYAASVMKHETNGERQIQPSKVCGQVTR